MKDGDAAEIAALLGVAIQQHQQGELQNAEAAYRSVLDLAPSHVTALGNLGIALFQLGRLDEAAEWLDRAVAANPNAPGPYISRGAVRNSQGRYAAALEDYDRAVGMNGARADVHFNRGNTLQALERLDDAVASYDRAIALQPDVGQFHRQRAQALQALGRFEEALASADQSLVHNPIDGVAHRSRGTSLEALHRLDEALESYDAAVALSPSDAVTAFNRGNILRRLRRVDEALASFEEAIAIKPDFAMAHHNRASCLLLLGRWPEGFAEYEWRKRAPGFDRDDAYAEPAWFGEDLTGKHLFIHAELFLGDVVQFSRYALVAEARGAKVTLAAPPPLRRLLSGLSPTVRVIATGEDPGPFDYHCALMSLPLACATRLDDVPAFDSYLRADPERVEHWRARLGDHGFKVGICWQGSTGAYAASMDRSAPLRAFGALAAIPGVRLISLQKHDGLDQLEDLPTDMQVETLGEAFDAGPDAFLDTAAVMQCCDLVLTVDTAVAHVAGALGVPTWITLPFVPDWRWLLEGATTAWYPSVRLFRQDAPGAWNPMFADVAAALQAMVSSRGQATRAPRVPVSWGEIIDKLTILEIKRRRLRDPTALANVGRELDLLLEIEAALAPDPRLQALRAGLAEVNLALWGIEDDIREKEALGDFGDGFIALARSVYRRNDERAALKRDINRLLSSELVEEKSYADYGGD